MEDHLKELTYHFETSSFSISNELVKIVESDFIDNNDCIVLSGVAGTNKNPEFPTSLEKSEWEYNESHFHPDSFVSADPKNEIEYLKAALECGKRLALRLKNSYPHKHFKVIISYNETTYDGSEVSSFGSSTVRFYQIRPEAENIMSIGNLDSFVSDAVMEVEI